MEIQGIRKRFFFCPIHVRYPLSNPYSISFAATENTGAEYPCLSSFFFVTFFCMCTCIYNRGPGEWKPALLSAHSTDGRTVPRLIHSALAAGLDSMLHFLKQPAP